MSTTLTDWDAIVQTQEYQDDYSLLKNLLTAGIATSLFISQDDVFVGVMAHLIALLRYHIRHLPEVTDIDLSPFLPYIQQEVGIELPLTQAIPVVEFLRENKSWYGHKGTESLYDFIGQVVGSEIEILYPRDHIWFWDDPNCFWSGAESDHGMLPWNESKVAYWRDGIFYALYTYVVRVLHAEAIVNYQDFLNLIKSIHPAGTQRFIWLESTFITDPTPATQMKSFEDLWEYSWQRNQWPTWDNGWMWSDPPSKWSMHGGSSFYGDMYVEEITL